MLERFKKFITQQGLFAAGERHLLAVSGGLDSVALAHLCHSAGIEFDIVHCNFQLRGIESDGDAVFVEKLTQKFGCQFFVKKFDTAGYAAQNGLSIQMAARQLRYAWFDALCEQQAYAAVATAHHLTDSGETLLLNLIRGAGLNGLSGIPLRRGRIVRPLLFATRRALEDWARAQALEWREDASNAGDDYDRNYIRHRVWPLLEALNPALESTLSRNMSRVQAAQRNYQFLLFQALGLNAGEPPLRVEKKRLEALPSLGGALNELYRAQGFTEDQLQQLAEHWDRIGGLWESAQGMRLLNDRQYLLLAAVEDPAPAPLLSLMPDDLMLRLPDGARLFLMPAEPRQPFPDAREAILADFEILKFPLYLRRWRAGDHFQPLGMGGHSRKLQDFFSDQKLSRFEKEQIWVLEDADERVVWVVGMRADERFKVTEKTQKALKISFLRAE